MEMTLQGAEQGVYLFPDTKATSEFGLPPPEYTPKAWLKIQPPIWGSELTHKFLGKYEAMFGNMQVESPIPSWEAMQWIMEDYGQSVSEDITYDQIYPKIS